LFKDKGGAQEIETGEIRNTVSIKISNLGLLFGLGLTLRK
jgi:hypothetical protein